jgi:hypothetical protein
MTIAEMLDEIIELAEEGIGYTDHYFIEKHKMNDQMNDVKGYKKQILSDFAKKDAEIKRLEAENEALKCCGNCTYFYDNECMKFPEIDGEYCDKWQSDELTFKFIAALIKSKLPLSR